MAAQPPPDASLTQAWEQACARIDPARLQQLIIDLTAIHSPTGAERAASEFLRDWLERAGVPARYQPITELSGNCIGRVRGTGDGPTVMLYAPIDTHLDADPATDVPWVGPRLRDDMLPKPRIVGDTIIGLGASNPKAMLATMVEAAVCIAQSGVQLRGDLLVVAGAGGMPWTVPERAHAGVSHGVMHLLSHGVAPDAGIILKPWDEVYWEHPGMSWFKVSVHGTMGYSGVPRGTPGFRSSVEPAARLVLELERWLAEYPDRHASEQVRPQGWVAAIRGGWPDKPSFPSATTEIWLDIRTSPDQTRGGVEAEFAEAMRSILARHPDIEATWEMTLSCQGARTDPSHWIVRSALRAWEVRHGRPYPGAPQMSGQTDAATINQMGIPLARLGYPFAPLPEFPESGEGLGGMGYARVADMLAPCRTVMHAAIDACLQTRGALGLRG